MTRVTRQQSTQLHESECKTETKLACASGECLPVLMGFCSPPWRDMSHNFCAEACGRRISRSRPPLLVLGHGKLSLGLLSPFVNAQHAVRRPGGTHQPFLKMPLMDRVVGPDAGMPATVDEPAAFIVAETLMIILRRHGLVAVGGRKEGHSRRVKSFANRSLRSWSRRAKT